MGVRAGLVSLLSLSLLTTVLAVAHGWSEGALCSQQRPCDNNGTCHTLTGECHCMPGYGGPLCASVMLPACRYTKETRMGMAPAMHCRREKDETGHTLFRQPRRAGPLLALLVAFANVAAHLASCRPTRHLSRRHLHLLPPPTDRGWGVKSCACMDQCQQYHLNPYHVRTTHCRAPLGDPAGSSIATAEHLLKGERRPTACVATAGWFPRSGTGRASSGRASRLRTSSASCRCRTTPQQCTAQRGIGKNR